MEKEGGEIARRNLKRAAHGEINDDNALKLFFICIVVSVPNYITRLKNASIQNYNLLKSFLKIYSNKRKHSFDIKVVKFVYNGAKI